jgi:hypothetical protein
VRLGDSVTERLSRYIKRTRLTGSAAIERFVDEGLRRETHPDITFRNDSAGRLASLAWGPAVWTVIGSLRAVQAERPDAAPEAVLADVVIATGLDQRRVRAAVNYYAEYPDEIDDWIDANDALATEHEAAWRREQEALIHRRAG